MFHQSYNQPVVEGESLFYWIRADYELKHEINNSKQIKLDVTFIGSLNCIKAVLSVDMFKDE